MCYLRGLCYDTSSYRLVYYCCRVNFFFSSFCQRNCCHAVHGCANNHARGRFFGATREQRGWRCIFFATSICSYFSRVERLRFSGTARVSLFLFFIACAASVLLLMGWSFSRQSGGGCHVAPPQAPAPVLYNNSTRYVSTYVGMYVLYVDLWM